MGLFIGEVSNPAMHSRIMLKFLGLRYSRSYEVAEFCYFIFFFMGRFVIGTPIVYSTIACDKMNMLTKLATIGVMAQSTQTLYRMYATIMRRFAEI